VAGEQADAAVRIADDLGVTLSEEERWALDRFWALLLTWNARINLTGARNQAELIGDHLPDALVMSRLVPRGARVVDVGSGGGLPAIPFAVLRPADELTLVEPRAKRVAFLRTAVRELGLAKVQVVAGRVEGLPAGSADVAASRATFAPGEWLQHARPLAPRALVFAARRGDVGVGTEWRLEDEATYTAGAGQPRWVGLFCST